MPNDLSNATWSETDGSNIAAPPNGWPAGMFPNQVEPTAQATAGALKRFWDRINGVYTSTGAAGTFNIATANAGSPAAFSQGETFRFKAHQPSVGADVFSANALLGVAFYKSTSTGLIKIAANDIVTGQMVEVTYDAALNGAAGGVHMQSPPNAAITRVEARVNRGGITQVIPSNVATKLQLNVVAVDNLGYYDPVAFRYTPLLAGVYLVTVQVYYTNLSGSPDDLIALVYKNGAEVARGVLTPQNTGTTTVACSTLVEINGTTDFIEGWTLNSDALPTNMSGLISGTFMNIIRVSQ